MGCWGQPVLGSVLAAGAAVQGECRDMAAGRRDRAQDRLLRGARGPLGIGGHPGGPGAEQPARQGPFGWGVYLSLSRPWEPLSSKTPFALSARGTQGHKPREAHCPPGRGKQGPESGDLPGSLGKAGGAVAAPSWASPPGAWGACVITRPGGSRFPLPTRPLPCQAALGGWVAGRFPGVSQETWHPWWLAAAASLRRLYSGVGLHPAPAGGRRRHISVLWAWGNRGETRAPCPGCGV